MLDAALPRDGAVGFDVDVHARLLAVVAAVAAHLPVVGHAAGPAAVLERVDEVDAVAGVGGALGGWGRRELHGRGGGRGHCDWCTEKKKVSGLGHEGIRGGSITGEDVCVGPSRPHSLARSLTVDGAERYATIAIVGVVPVEAPVLEAAVALQLEGAGVEAEARVPLRARPRDRALDVRALHVGEGGGVIGVDDHDVLARVGGAQLVAHVLRELPLRGVVAVVDAADQADDQGADRLADVDARFDEGDDGGHGEKGLLVALWGLGRGRRQDGVEAGALDVGDGRYIGEEIAEDDWMEDRGV